MGGSGQQLGADAAVGQEKPTSQETGDGWEAVRSSLFKSVKKEKEKKETSHFPPLRND